MGIFNVFSSGYTMEMTIVVLLAYILAIVIAIVCHEFAHAFVAHKNGDDTAKVAGRMTLNPAAHFDPLGFLCLLLIGFGWAKPVPVDERNFKSLKKGRITVGFAGVLTNLILGIISVFLYVLFFNVLDTSVYIWAFVVIFFEYFALINFMLAIFNLLPIFPLDGFNIIATFTKPENKFVRFMYSYGSLLLIVLLLAGLGYGINFVVTELFNWLVSLAVMIF